TDPHTAVLYTKSISKPEGLYRAAWHYAIGTAISFASGLGTTLYFSYCKDSSSKSLSTHVAENPVKAYLLAINVPLVVFYTTQTSLSLIEADRNSFSAPDNLKGITLGDL
ncbi:MAG: hypothetical protein WCK42_08405, partial [Myxococcaceae bacterium]